MASTPSIHCWHNMQGAIPILPWWQYIVFKNSKAHYSMMYQISFMHRSLVWWSICRHPHRSLHRIRQIPHLWRSWLWLTVRRPIVWRRWCTHGTCYTEISKYMVYFRFLAIPVNNIDTSQIKHHDNLSKSWPI